MNVGSRMENSSLPNNVQISSPFYSKLKGDKSFTFEPRGIIDIKGKGEMKTYFIHFRDGDGVEEVLFEGSPGVPQITLN